MNPGQAIQVDAMLMPWTPLCCFGIRTPSSSQVFHGRQRDRYRAGMGGDAIEGGGPPATSRLNALGHGGVRVHGGPDQFAANLGATAVLDTSARTLMDGPCVL
jgi:hypothetical protein